MPKDYKKINKDIRKEALREELKAREYLKQIEEVAQAVTTNWETLSAPQVGALRLKAEVNFKRLDKVLPDLKAIELEHKGEVINRVISSVPLDVDEWEKEYGSGLETSVGASESSN